MRPGHLACALAVLLAASLCGAGAAGAAEREDLVRKARRHYSSGRALYDQGHFREAIVEFRAGYEASRRPSFLLNIGQAHRQLFELEEALAMYRQFLAEAPADDPDRPQVAILVVQLERVVAARDKERTAAVTPANVGSASVSGESPARRFIKRHWWIFPVIGVVVAGAVVGGVLGWRATHAESCGTLGCVDTIGGGLAQ